METIRRAVSSALFGTALIAGAAACTDRFLAVSNPNVVDANSLDPVANAATLAASVQQNYTTAAANRMVYTAFAAGEAYATEFGTGDGSLANRNVPTTNPILLQTWQQLSVAAASGKVLLDLTLPNPSTNIHIARAATFRAYAILDLATTFCTTALSGGPELTTNQTLDSAIFWFGKAVDVGRANASSDGTSLANAALVGRARAKLQRGDKVGALADAVAVPAGFTFNLNYTDDVSNRFRLSNQQWLYTATRGIISVPPYYRTTDPRTPWLPPDKSSYTAVDGSAGPLYVQMKYPSYGAPVRLASSLEAQYLAAEASENVNQQLLLINQRRAASGNPAYGGPTDAASVLLEMFNQEALDFWLEGKRWGDWRRQPIAAATNVPVTGTTYWRGPSYGLIGSQTCLPMPYNERINNPNIKS